MLPILIKLGPVTIYSYGVFLALGLFGGLYFWWKIGRDEHWNENELFDIYFVSLFSYFLVGRASYILFNPELNSLKTAFSFLAHPGLLSWMGILSSFVVVYFMSRKNSWDWWKVLDAWVVVLSVVILTTSLGVLLNGSMPGVVSQHLGFVHPGDSEPRFSLEILLVLISLVIFGIVSRVRKNFRFYSWYKGDASVAKDGLAGLLWGVLVCVGVAIGSFGAVTPYIGIVPRLFVLGIIGAIILSSVIYWRSGKNRGERLLDYFKKRKESK